MLTFPCKKPFMLHIRFTLLGIGAIGCGLCFCLSAHGQTVSWTNTTAGGNWSSAGNWSPNAVPGPLTNVFITNTVSTAYVVTNNVLNNTFSNLTLFSMGTAGPTLLSLSNGFNPTGQVIIGQRGILAINGSSATVGGSVTVSNLGSVSGTWRVLNGGTATVNGFYDNGGNLFVQGNSSVLSILGGAINRATLTISTNGTLNIGGASEAAANASLVTFTNLAGATLTMATAGGQVSTLNASTNGIGILNQGTLQGSGSNTGLVNAAVYNDTSGLISSPSLNNLHLLALPSNQGTVTVVNVNSHIRILGGNVTNSGLIQAPAGGEFSLGNGSLINNGSIIYIGGGGTFTALSTLNNGTLVISNTTASTTFFNLGGPLTNAGTMLIYRTDPNGSSAGVFSSSNVVNTGALLAIGKDVAFTNTMTVAVIPSPVTNQSSGTIIATNGAVLAFTGDLQNQGSLMIQTNAVIGVGANQNQRTPIRATVGTVSFRNDGSITLSNATFATTFLTNASGATLQGSGGIGTVAFSNLYYISGSITNATSFVREFRVANIVNSGNINPGGVLNAGTITNLSGSQIVGFGTIQSISVTNSYDANTNLLTTSFNTGARIQNNAGATVLASGGMLVLSNGFVANSNDGLIGGTNGGRLQIGDGTLALTNNSGATVRLTGGELASGDLRNNGAIQFASGTNALLVSGSLTLAGGITMSASNSINSVAGIVSNLGTIQVVFSKMTYSNSVVTSGRYISDPSTNTFLDALTLASSGTLEGGAGDLFDFKKNLLIHSTNTGLFDLASSTVSFSGSVSHTNEVTGLDLGAVYDGLTSTNFSYGRLVLGTSDNLYFLDGDSNPSNTNALYIGALDLGGSPANVSLLHSSFNIYYDALNPDNAYLASQTYSIGGGSLIPIGGVIPEPSAFVLALGGVLIACLRIRRRN